MAGRKMKYWITIIVLLVTLGIVGFLFYPKWVSNGSNQKFRTTKVERGDISYAVTATGTINPVITVLVGSQVSGTIKALFADFNSQVKQGQVIAQIDPAIFEAQVQQGRASVINTQANLLNTQASLKNAQANLQNFEANLEKAEVAVLDTKRTLDRNVELMKRNVIAQSTLDTAQANYDSAVAQRESAKAQVETAKSQIESAKAQIESARAQIEQARASLRVSETNLNYTTIRSPVNGTVISRNVDVGQTVAASLQAPTLFTIAKDLTEMQVDTNVSEADVGRIEVGQESTFTVDAYPERTFRGRVSEVRNAPTTIQNVVTYDVVIQVGNKDLKLKPGMTANASVLIAHKEGVLKIPNAALRFRPVSAKTERVAEKRKETPPSGGGKKLEKESDGNKPGRVWVLSPEGKPVPVSIVLGITNGTYSEVVSSDLQEGAEVIVEEASGKKSQGQSGTSPSLSRGLGR